MLILMHSDAKQTDMDGVVKKIQDMGFKAHVIPGATGTAIGVTGNPGALDPRVFEVLPGVARAIPVTKSYKLAGRDFKPTDTMIEVGDITIGPGFFTLMAGPCAVESEEQTIRIAKAVKAAGAHILRGGAYKPRTSPYAFQGLGEDGLKILSAARSETGMPIITEALDQRSLDVVAKYADIVQIGARNMQNFALLRDCGKIGRPVMLKRGLSATIDEWLQSAEYLLAEGNPNVMLCERGIRTFSSHTRNTLDLNAVPVVQSISHLPVLVDPSHGTGLRDKVAPLSRASAAVGANGVIIEVHDRPDQALCDGPQALHPDAFAAIVKDIKAMGPILGYKA